MRTKLGNARVWLAALAVAAGAGALAGCELLVDFDRSKIPAAGQGDASLTDSGPAPNLDASMTPDGQTEGGTDAGSDGSPVDGAADGAPDSATDAEAADAEAGVTDAADGGTAADADDGATVSDAPDDGG